MKMNKYIYLIIIAYLLGLAIGFIMQSFSKDITNNYYFEQQQNDLPYEYIPYEIEQEYLNGNVF